MAKSEQYSCSSLGASEEVPDIYCEPCHQAGHAAIAEGYCMDCPEYLCGPCYISHQRHKALTNHVLLDKESMPLSTDSRRRVLDVCEEKCPIHPNKVIELFCETCDKLVCTICVATDHRQCEKVKHIPDIVKGLEHTREFQKLNEDIKSTANALSEHEEKLQANVSCSGEMRKHAKQELKRQRAEVNRFFDKLEKKIDEQITAIEERNKDTLKAASDRLDHMKKDLDQIKNDMEVKSTEQRCKLFIAMKRSQKNLMTFRDQINTIQEELRIQHYTLVPSEQIQAMMRTTTEIGRIATARFESDIMTDDKINPYISSLTMMHGHFCVLLDFVNKSIKVIDTKSKCLISEISIQAYAIKSLTSVSNDRIAVSVLLLGLKPQIQFFTVSASGVIQRTNQLYDVDSYYSSMVYCVGNIYGVAYDRIDKLSMKGKIIRTIHTVYAGYLRGIAASPDGQTLFVTNSEKQSVTSMTLDGEIKAIYKDKDLKTPIGITVDKYGYVYVCSYNTKKIHQLTADLNKVQVLIGDVDNSSIIYSSTENKLYISFLNLIHQYSMGYE